MLLQAVLQIALNIAQKQDYEHGAVRSGSNRHPPSGITGALPLCYHRQNTSCLRITFDFWLRCNLLDRLSAVGTEFHLVVGWCTVEETEGVPARCLVVRIIEVIVIGPGAT